MSDHDPFNPEQSKEDARRESFVQHAQHAEDIKRLMSEAWGRRLMWEWLEFCGVYRLSFTGQAPRTDFAEGTRNVGLMLLSSIMQHSPETWLLMHNEAQAAKLERKVAKQRGRRGA